MPWRWALLVAVALPLSLAGRADGETYRWLDPQGRVHYSNLEPLNVLKERSQPATPSVELTSSPPEPAPPGVDRESLVQELLEASLARVHLAEVPARVRAQVAARRRDLRPADYASFSRVITESYGSDVLRQSVTEAFGDLVDDRRLVPILERLRSPLLRKITGLRVQASTPEGARDLRQFAAQLGHRPTSQSRWALIRRVDQAAGLSQLDLDIAAATVRGIALAIDPLVPSGQQLKTGELDQALNQMRANVRGPLQTRTAVHLLYAYRPLRDEELAQYVAFLESDNGRWFLQASRQALTTALTGAAERASRETQKIAPSQDAPPRHRAPAPPSDDPRRWALAVSSLLTGEPGHRNDLLGGVERSHENVENARRTLRQRWGINDRADLFATLKWLDEGGQRQEVEQLGRFVRSLSQEQYAEMLARARQHLGAWHRLRTAAKYAAGSRKEILLGWDYGRYIHLCRQGYVAGYLSERETWDRIMSAARVLQAAFGSWQDLAEDYLLGLEFSSPWSSPTDIQRYRNGYRKLLGSPQSLWTRYAWETNLEDAALKAAPEWTRPGARNQ